MVAVLPCLHLSRPGDGEQVFIPVVGAVQVVAVLRIPEIDLDAAGPDDVGIPVRGTAVERARRDFYLGYTRFEVAPIRDAVVATLKDKGIAVLDAIRIIPPTRWRRTGREVGAVARRKKAAEPDVELGR